MHHRHLRLAYPSLLSVVVLLVAAGSAAANYMDLLRRVPDSANTLIMIDVERLLMSPIAMKEKWRDKVNSSQGESLHFPIDAVRYLLASKLDFVSGFEDIWDAALIETISDVSLPYMSKMEGGYLDTVEGQQVAFSPRNAFFVSFKPTILGVSFPANRQDLGRWLRQDPESPGSAGFGVSPASRPARAWQGSRRRRVRPRRLVHEPPDSRPAAWRREPRGQGRRSRRSDESAHLDEGCDPHRGCDRPTERKDAGRFR